MLPGDFWAKWKEILLGQFALPPHYEWTVEANPETITVDLAQSLAAAGVNRVSLGVQSFVTE